MVRNTGTRPGREVVQAYVAPPPEAWAEAEAEAEAGAGDGAERRPVRALAAFGAAVGPPGETAEVRLRIPARAFARYDEDTDAWIWPRGEYTIQVGRSSRDLPLSVPVSLG